MSCIQRDRAHRCWVLHAGTLVARILVSRKNWMCKHEGGSSWKANSGRNTNPQVPALSVPACRAVELYPMICSSWRSNTAVRTYIAVPCFQSTLFDSAKKTGRCHSHRLNSPTQLWLCIATPYTEGVELLHILPYTSVNVFVLNGQWLKCNVIKLSKPWKSVWSTVKPLTRVGQSLDLQSQLWLYRVYGSDTALNNPGMYLVM